MKCFLIDEFKTESSVLIDGRYFSLKECNPEQEALVTSEIEKYWYLYGKIVSFEEDGGWSGTSTEVYIAHNMIEEDVVILDNKVIGFMPCGKDSQAYSMFYPIDMEGQYLKSEYVRYYSFDHGDGDGTSHYSFALLRKDKRIVEFIKNHHIFEECTNRFGYRDISYLNCKVVEDDNTPYYIDISTFGYRGTSNDVDIRKRGEYNRFVTLKKIDDRILDLIKNYHLYVISGADKYYRDIKYDYCKIEKNETDGSDVIIIDYCDVILTSDEVDIQKKFKNLCVTLKKKEQEVL